MILRDLHSDSCSALRLPLIDGEDHIVSIDGSYDKEEVENKGNKIKARIHSEDIADWFFTFNTKTKVFKFKVRATLLPHSLLPQGKISKAKCKPVKI